MSEISSPATPPRWFLAIMPVAVVATLALLTVNVWFAADLLRERRASSRERDFWVLCQPGSTPAEREAAFRHLVAAGNTEWRSADLRGLNLSRVPLAGADLQYATFQRTNLAGALLDGAKLCVTSLELADLTGAQISQANLKEVRLLQATLKGATLRRSNLSAGILEQAQAQDADFVAADLSDANCLMTNFSGAKLMGTNFSGAKLESAVFKAADLSLARLDGADLTDADFTNANWWRARGLTTGQLDYLKGKFSPNATATAALREDYARWAGTMEAR